MSISMKTEKMLWGRAANRCAICKRELVLDSTETDDESIVGDACHIVAESPGGPRGSSDMSSEQRDKYGNLVLLCKVHHKQIDDQRVAFTVEKLSEIKREHEEWVRKSLSGYDPLRQRNEEILTDYIDHWSSAVNIDDWRGWCGSLMGPQPALKRERLDSLEELRRWILSRIWPQGYDELQSAFDNFRFVLDDLVKVFREHAVVLEAREVYLTEKFYKINEYDEERYSRLLDQYHFHVDLVHDLVLELTRAANFICDHVRMSLLPSYRMIQGIVLLDSGPYGFMEFITHRTEYRDAERTPIPYPGLEVFRTLRTSRDYHFAQANADAADRDGNDAKNVE